MTRGDLSPADLQRHAALLANRVRKNFRRLHQRFEREGVGAFRLYDWDIPEVRASVDWYEGQLVVAEFERQQTQTVADWLGTVGRAAAEALGVPPEKLHLKKRRTRPGKGTRYERLAQRNERLQVREGALRFWVNLEDYIDTGLFLDHRETRRLVGEKSKGRSVLNLFAYTGSFSCYAAAGGASRTLTIDQSATYIDWARDNLKLNGLLSKRHALMRADVGEALKALAAKGQRFELCVLDPPSFSSRLMGRPFEVQRDHPALIRAALGALTKDGVLYFSTNHQRFEPRLEGLDARPLEGTLPIDFRNEKAHSVFEIRP